MAYKRSPVTLEKLSEIFPRPYSVAQLPLVPLQHQRFMRKSVTVNGGGGGASTPSRASNSAPKTRIHILSSVTTAPAAPAATCPGARACAAASSRRGRCSCSSVSLTPSCRSNIRGQREEYTRPTENPISPARRVSVASAAISNNSTQSSLKLTRDGVARLCDR